MSGRHLRAGKVGATARIIACTLAAVLAVLQFPALAACADPADLGDSTAQHDPCHDARLTGDDDACAHQIEPDPVAAPDALAPVGLTAAGDAAAPAYRTLPRRPLAQAPSRRPPPLAPASVSLFLLHLHLLN